MDKTRMEQLPQIYSLDIVDIIEEISHSLPDFVKEKLTCLSKATSQTSDIKIKTEVKPVFDWNSEIINLTLSDSESETEEESQNIFSVDDINKFEIGGFDSLLDNNAFISNNEYITFTDLDDIPDHMSNVTKISNYQDALEHVKNLQTFAIDADDIVAIELLSNLKLHFKNKLLN